MKVVKQTKDLVTIELTPMELDLFRSGITKESSHRRRTWKQVDPRFPEEVMYHVLTNDTANHMKIEANKIIKTYQSRWGMFN